MEKSNNRLSIPQKQISDMKTTVRETENQDDTHGQDNMVSGNVIPRITKECQDLSSLILETKQCVRDILDFQVNVIPRRTRGCISNESADEKEFSMLIECRQSLIDCLDCLFNIKTYLKHRSSRKMKRTKRHPMSSIMNPNDNFSDKNLRVLSSSSSDSTPPTSCTGCGPSPLVTSKSSPPYFPCTNARQSFT